MPKKTKKPKIKFESFRLTMAKKAMKIPDVPQSVMLMRRLIAKSTLIVQPFFLKLSKKGKQKAMSLFLDWIEKTHELTFSPAAKRLKAQLDNGQINLETYSKKVRSLAVAFEAQMAYENFREFCSQHNITSQVAQQFYNDYVKLEEKLKNLKNP